MGTTISSIHVFTKNEIALPDLMFNSFSCDWQTCMTGFSDIDEECCFYTAKLISKQISAPVLCFSMFDSDYICFHFFVNGKRVASYSDDAFSQNKNLKDNFFTDVNVFT